MTIIRLQIVLCPEIRYFLCAYAYKLSCVDGVLYNNLGIVFITSVINLSLFGGATASILLVLIYHDKDLHNSKFYEVVLDIAQEYRKILRYF